MRYRTILITAEIVGAICLTVAVAKTIVVSNSQDPVTFDKVIPIKIEEPPLVDNVLPLIVRCEDAHLTAPNTLDKFYCTAINNTNKNISAMASELTIVTEKSDQTESRNTTSFIDDSFVHPDIREMRHLKATLPGAARTIQPAGPITFEDETITRIELTIKYIQFEDDTSIGANSEGAKAIRAIREGAARYKEWIVNKYTVNKGNVEAVVPLLKDDAIPAELRFGDDENLNQGARMYRQALRGIFESQGNLELKKVLGKKNTTSQGLHP